jgi:proteasome lid subunit RPN8/RPN11
MLKRFKKKTEEQEKDQKSVKNEIEKEQDNSKEEVKEEQKKKKDEKPIIIKAEAYKTIILYASRYANKFIPSEQWKEIYGILIGYSDDDFVYVEKAEALTYGHTTDVQLNEQHYGFIEEIQNKLDKDKTTKGYYMIGWFHSHPGLGLFFSYIDLINQLGFQARNEDFCGLVFDHTLLGKKKQEKVKGTEHTITKYDTGFEIYRMTDVNLDVNNPKFDNNYHKVDYIIDGLNKFFFANVLSELSALVSAGKPLQSAYGEEYELESSYQEPSEVIKQQEIKEAAKEKIDSISEGLLKDIPISEDIKFDVDDLFYDDTNKKRKETATVKEAAEQSIFEGNQAFKQKDAFMGVEKYREGIDKYKMLNDYDRVLELLKNLSEHCIQTNHNVLAEEFAEELYNISVKRDHLFYKGQANYLIGYLMTKKEDGGLFEEALKKIQQASIDYENADDFAGAGLCYNKIGTIYQSRLNQTYNAALFYEQAIRSLNEAILRGHPLRKSLWSKPESLSQKILEIKDIVEELISRIENPEEQEKIKKDLNSIQLNF